MSESGSTGFGTMRPLTTQQRLARIRASVAHGWSRFRHGDRHHPDGSVPGRNPRTSRVDSLRVGDPEVLIIGGGINGLGTLRDLALQGVTAALVERGDFMSGASSASSHMIHGGIRYLENGEFRLVREAVSERNDLLRTAPHYVTPLETVVPLYHTFSGLMAAPARFLTHRQRNPKARGALLVLLGMTIYDFFSRGSDVSHHAIDGRAKSLRIRPALNPAIRYTARYIDSSIREPERLGIDLLQDALSQGSWVQAANYVEVIGATAAGVRLRDALGGAEFTLRPRVVINTSGPWTDVTNVALGTPTTYMGGTRGSHIVLDNHELFDACRGSEMFFENSDGRIVLIYPLNGRVLVGTTDIPADPRQPTVCTDDEIDYFFEFVKHVFPSIPTGRDQIVFTYSGIRPLPHTSDMQPGFVSRDYRIERNTLVSGTPTLSLVGGKFTTFRAVSEHLAELALAELNKTRTVTTFSLPIGGGRDFPTDNSEREAWLRLHLPNTERMRAAALLERYGTRAVEFATPSVALENAPGFTVFEVAHLARSEQVVHLDDFFLRRTSLAFTGELSDALAREVAEILAPLLGWSAGRVRDELDRLRVVMAERHGVALRRPEPVLS